MSISKLTLPFTLTIVFAAIAPAFATMTPDCTDDAKIKASLEVMLDERAELGPPSSIHVQSIDHVVYLSGLVDTSVEKWLAESTASQTPGVKRVVNSIEQHN